MEKFKQVMELLSHRRVWASFFAIVALVLPQLNIDQNAAVTAVMNLVEAISGISAIVLPIWSILKPKV